MIEKIGENAGRVYECLRGKGKISFNALVKGSGLKAKDADRAIGWLAREGKIALEMNKKEEFVTLLE